MGCGCTSNSNIICPAHQLVRPQGIIEGTKFLFPKPKLSNFLMENRHLVMYIPLQNRNVPVFLYEINGASKFIIYLHGNCEDIGHINGLLGHLSSDLKAHLLALEYPGYGFYTDKKISSRQIDADAEDAMEFIINKLNVPLNRIIIMGRSIGTGPAAYLATKYKALCLIMISPFSSIKDACKSLAGTIGYFLIKDCWNNEQSMEQIAMPTLLVHGKKDEIIPYQQSEAISKKFINGASELVLYDNMQHNKMCFEDHIKTPIEAFLKKIDSEFPPFSIPTEAFKGVENN